MEERAREEENIRKAEEKIIENTNAYVYDSNNNIDMEATRILASKRMTQIAEREGYEQQNKNAGIPIAPGENSEAYLKGGANAVFNDIRGKVSTQLSTTVRSALQRIKDGETDVLPQLDTFLQNFIIKEKNIIANSWRGKDQETFNQFIDNQVAMYRQLLTGGEGTTPLGIVKSLESVSKIDKELTHQQFRRVAPLITGISENYPPEIAKLMLNKVLLKITPDLKQDSGSQIEKEMRVIFGLDPKKVTNLGYGPEYETNEQLETAVNVSLKATNQLLKSTGLKQEDRLKTLFSFQSPIYQAHLKGELSPDNYETIRKQYSDPVFKSLVESLPKDQQKQLGDLGFNIYNSAAEKSLKQIESIVGFEGIEYDDGKINIKINEEALDAVTKMSGNFGQIESKEKELNKFFNDMVYYSSYTKLGAFGGEKFVSDLLGEQFVASYPIKEIGPMIKDWDKIVDYLTPIIKQKGLEAGKIALKALNISISKAVGMADRASQIYRGPQLRRIVLRETIESKTRKREEGEAIGRENFEERYKPEDIKKSKPSDIEKTFNE